jgi:hypothetical protein
MEDRNINKLNDNTEFLFQLIQFKERVSFQLWQNFSDKNLISLHSSIIETIVSIYESDRY